MDIKSAFKAPFNGPHTKESVKDESTTQAEVQQNAKGSVAAVAGATTERTETDYETPIYETTTTTTQVSLSYVGVAVSIINEQLICAATASSSSSFKVRNAIHSSLPGLSFFVQS